MAALNSHKQNSGRWAEWRPGACAGHESLETANRKWCSQRWDPWEANNKYIFFFPREIGYRVKLLLISRNHPQILWTTLCSDRVGAYTCQEINGPCPLVSKYIIGMAILSSWKYVHVGSLTSNNYYNKRGHVEVPGAASFRKDSKYKPILYPRGMVESIVTLKDFQVRG